MKLKHLLVNIIGKLTGCYNYGKNNKVVFVNVDKEIKRFFMPKGLTIKMRGNNNLVIISKKQKFVNTTIDLEGDNGQFSVKYTLQKIKDANFIVDTNCKILIEQNCQLGNGNLMMLANKTYNEPARIVIGNNVFIARNALIRTSDGHTIIDATTKEPLNPTEDVIIEDNVWITSNCTILKGTYIPKGCIVGACSMVNKKFVEENCMIAGTPAKVIKHNITWDAKDYGSYASSYYQKG